MKTSRELKKTERLLDAVLADDGWRALSRSLKREALAAVATARRTRRRRLWLGQACAASLLIAAAWWWLPPSPRQSTVTQKSEQPAPPRPGGPFVSEEQMLAMFPPGSCVVAEVDGHRELVFFDAKKAREGFVLGGAARP